MTAWERMQLRMNIGIGGLHGSDIRSDLVYNSKRIIDELLPDDPSYRENILILGKGPTNMRMWNYKLVEARTTPQMDIQASLEQEHMFTLGDIIEYEGYWIVIKSHDRHRIERTGQVEECNFYLRWQNPTTHEIHGRWTSLRDPSSLALDERGMRVTTGQAQYTLKLPSDEETRLFEVGTRFLIDMANNTPIPYEVIKFDNVSSMYMAREEGFMNLLLRQTELMPEEDNYELMIANYVDVDQIPPPYEPPVHYDPPFPDARYTIRFSGNPVIRQGSRTRIFRALSNIIDPNGDPYPITSPISWSLDLPPNLIDLVVIDGGGPEMRLRIDSSAPIGATFLLRLTVDDYVAEQELKIGGLT